ncbi:type II toxin-antitoxin system VapC family toxin [Salinibacter ruber]|uniref:type II toxin-antitoxin system VapC family toxin n=1 Tax=Salinibacter ruber TaxID=146919 RepID=UPI00311AB700
MLTTYVDTSVLAAYHCPEPLSEQSERRVRALNPPVISRLTDVELHSALAKKVRRDELTEEDAQRVQELFRDHCDRGLYHTVSIQDTDFLQARRWMAQRSTALRTLDALHLATANRHELRVLTADRIMNRAGRHLDLPVERLREE